MASVLDHCRDLPLRTFATGETVLTEGDRSGLLYILASGAVEVLKDDVQINVVSEPGTFFGEVSILLDEPHTASVRAVDTSTFYVADDPLAFIGSCPEIALAISRLLARRLHFVTTYLVDLKRQFAGSGDHLTMVDEVLESLVHHQDAEASPGSDRCPEPDPTTE
jgi:CRP/FNR family cyclic AMP-dependent transcriptional regulator